MVGVGVWGVGGGGVMCAWVWRGADIVIWLHNGLGHIVNIYTWGMYLKYLCFTEPPYVLSPTLRLSTVQYMYNSERNGKEGELPVFHTSRYCMTWTY